MLHFFSCNGFLFHFCQLGFSFKETATLKKTRYSTYIPSGTGHIKTRLWPLFVAHSDSSRFLVLFSPLPIESKYLLCTYIPTEYILYLKNCLQFEFVISYFRQESVNFCDWALFFWSRIWILQQWQFYNTMTVFLTAKLLVLLIILQMITAASWVRKFRLMN